MDTDRILITKVVTGHRTQNSGEIGLYYNCGAMWLQFPSETRNLTRFVIHQEVFLVSRFLDAEEVEGLPQDLTELCVFLNRELGRNTTRVLLYKE